ncbi:MAG: VanZ family protein [Candidatus Omnitrophota bacterium]|nr:VanZ family protein [Candidatus Omnitrophota bacterium]
MTKIWLALGVTLISVMVVFAVTPISKNGIAWSLNSLAALGLPLFLRCDSTLHVSTYFLLTLWFAQLVKRVHHNKLAVGMILLGLSVEFLQPAIGTRSFQIHDILANSLGILAGYWVARTPASLLLRRLDRKLHTADI